MVLALSCGDETVNKPDEKDGYVVEGVLFYNYDDESSLCYFELTKDSKAFSDANVKVEGQTIAHTGQGVYHAVSPSFTLTPGGTHTVTIQSSDGDTLFTQDFILPDTFTVIVTNPPNHTPYDAGGFVTLEWTGSAYSQGYIVTLVRPDSALDVVPFAEFANAGTSALQIGPSAFQKPDGTDISGTYDVYVLSYRGTFYTWPDIFFPLPSPLPTDNITGKTFTGTIGVGTLSKGDYITAVKLP